MSALHSVLTLHRAMLIPAIDDHFDSHSACECELASVQPRLYKSKMAAGHEPPFCGWHVHSLPTLDLTLVLVNVMICYHRRPFMNLELAFKSIPCAIRLIESGLSPFCSHRNVLIRPLREPRTRLVLWLAALCSRHGYSLSRHYFSSCVLWQYFLVSTSLVSGHNKMTVPCSSENAKNIVSKPWYCFWVLAIIRPLWFHWRHHLSNSMIDDLLKSSRHAHTLFSLVLRLDNSDTIGFLMKSRRIAHQGY